MHINRIAIKNFRCFKQFEVDINQSIVVINGPNGSGKSTLLEALHYGCYLRSFRTHLAREIVRFEQENFFIKVNVQHTEEESTIDHELSVGFSKKKRVVKIDNTPLSSYKELSNTYRVITITEDDLSLIKEGPEMRRLFLDQAISLKEADYLAALKRYKHILESRNALLFKGNFSHDSYKLWTHQLWQQALILQRYRTTLLNNLQRTIKQLIEEWFEQELTLEFSYTTKKIVVGQTFEEFLDTNQDLLNLESMLKRSLFGAHLDDFSINFCHRTSRSFASRGQQKLIVMLIKIAQLKDILANKGQAIFLLDDYLTDFDEKRASVLLKLLTSLKSQLIFTSPTKNGSFEKILEGMQVQTINLTH